MVDEARLVSESAVLTAWSGQRETVTETDKEIETDRQAETDAETETERQRQRETDRQRETHRQLENSSSFFFFYKDFNLGSV